MPLVWTRKQDGHKYSGRPIYEYYATADTVRFHICYAIDGGFGLSAFDDKAQRYISERHGIQWCRTLRNCKAMAEKLLIKHRAEPFRLHDPSKPYDPNLNPG